MIKQSIAVFVLLTLTALAHGADRIVTGIPKVTSTQLLIKNENDVTPLSLPLSAITPEQREKLKSYYSHRLEVSLRLDATGTKVMHMRRTGNGTWPVNASESAIREGVNYSFRVGQNNFGGVATLTKSRGKYTIRLPLQIAGGILFAQSSPQESQEWMRLPAAPPAEYFLRGATSIEEIPALKKRVLHVLSEIEAMYRTPFCELKIVPTFVRDESRILDREELELGNGGTQSYVAALVHGLQKLSKRSRKMAIFVNPVGNPNSVSPTSWDIFSDPYLSAHEIGHILGIPTEGYFFNDYSPVALMNDSYALAAVKRFAPDQKPRLDITDFNTLISYIAPLLSPSIPIETARKEFTATHRALLKEPRGDYYSFSHAQRMKLARDSVRRWFGLN